MLNIFRYMKGFLRIRVSGFSPERFMNLCCSHGILLWEILPCKDFYEMNISLSQFYRLKPILRKTKTKVHIIEKIGFPFVLARWKKRKIFLSGFLFCFAILMYLSTFIWAIEIEGNEQLTKEMLLTFLSENHITHGTEKKQINIDKLEKKLRNEYPFITWTSAKMEGTKLTIAVKENDVDTGTKLVHEANADLVSDTNGIVESIVTRKGVPLVKQGQEIKAGDLLISGAIPIVSDDQQIKAYQMVRADGDVFVKYEQRYTDTLPAAYQRKKYTGKEKKTYSFTAFGHTFHIFNKPEDGMYQCISTKKQLELLDDFFLPFYLEIKCYSQYEIIQNKHTKEEMQEILNKNLRDFCDNLEQKGVQILEKNVKIVWKSEQAILDGKLYLLKRVDCFRSIQLSTDTLENKDEKPFRSEISE